MKTKNLLFLFGLFALLCTTGCSKDNSLADNQKNIKKLWKLDNLFVNGTDVTSSMTVSSYEESYQDNGKYDRSYTDRNNNKSTQNGAYEFENANRLKISGVGSIEFTGQGTASSSYYDIIKLTDTQLWYSYTNGNMKYEFRLSRKS